MLFGLPGERLVIRHDEQSDGGIFVEGSLLAARRVREHAGLVRGLDSLLFDERPAALAGAIGWSCGGCAPAIWRIPGISP